MTKARLTELLNIVLEDLLKKYDEEGDMLDLIDNLYNKGFTDKELRDIEAFDGLIE